MLFPLLSALADHAHEDSKSGIMEVAPAHKHIALSEHMYLLL